MRGKSSECQGNKIPTECPKHKRNFMPKHCVKCWVVLLLKRAVETEEKLDKLIAHFATGRKLI